ncbi:MAG: 16S rRNA (cytosine(1402)-N(4))-methyltransferase RsmH [Candidatus Buchananbacteria bacterium]|nr:16S rRNA (cytosine(1402)-N(4))-methyltransferase RsmH [Candidatus Buchananbacteria bacterium]
MKFEHKPVLLDEVVEYLKPQPNQNFIDCTVGGGGHAKAILQKTGPNGKLLGIDLDIQAIEAAKQNLQEFKDRIILINDNYQNLKQILYDTGFNKINGILLDLGLSSYQIQAKTRGFSFKGDSFLDMRFGETEQTAADIINKYKEADLIRIFKEYGEERYAKQIAQEIVDLRKKQPITKTNQLVDIIEKVYKNKPKPKKIHVATKVFQALRIEVNNELANLKKILPQALEALFKNGRLVVISFHSLEDKIVKEFFKKESKDCLCPPQIPVCVCEHKAQLKILTKKVVKPSQTEIMKNPRSRSAKLRAVVKI